MMNTTHRAPLELKSGLPWAKIVVTGIVAALGYFVMNLVQRRRFYKDLVCLVFSISQNLQSSSPSPSHNHAPPCRRLQC